MREEFSQAGQLKSLVLFLDLISHEDDITPASSPALPPPLDPVCVEQPLTVMMHNPSQASVCLREKSYGL